MKITITKDGTGFLVTIDLELFQTAMPHLDVVCAGTFNNWSKDQNSTFRFPWIPAPETGGFMPLKFHLGAVPAYHEFKLYDLVYGQWLEIDRVPNGPYLGFEDRCVPNAFGTLNVPLRLPNWAD